MLDVHRAILADLKAARAADRPHLAYFTVVHLYNHPDISDFDLRVTRAALSKAINSMSWQPDIVVPKEVDPEGTILRVDFANWGGTRTIGMPSWRPILTA